MTHLEIREKFLKFFEERGHKRVPSSSLLPTDPSVLFTTAGMQQFKPYYTGEADPMKDFGSLNVASIQKCMRTSDIDEVGDDSHLTFFEMLGNFSFGGYWKKEAIEYAYKFITEEMGLEIDYVTIFGGEGDVPADEESEKIWKSVDPKIEIKKFGRADNFWGPTGGEGPCGPTSEIYVKGIEVWNLVFNQYYQHKDMRLENLKTNGIDTGMGLERLATVVQKKNNIFETGLFEPMVSILPYNLSSRERRIIVDHARASVFLISDGVIPSNKDRGSILRKLMRTIMTQGNLVKSLNIQKLLEIIIKNYIDIYSNLSEQKIISEWQKEEKTFSRVLTTSEELKKTLNDYKIELESKPVPVSKKITTQTVAGIIFNYKQSKGLPLEISVPISLESGVPIDKNQLKIDEESFISEHASVSSVGSEKKFGGHGLILDTGELKAGNEEELDKVTRLHTATHLLHATLRKVLGDEVHQAGSDITAERLRFDFTFPRKMTLEEIKKVEDLVNDAIRQGLQVTMQEMPYEEAIKKDAMAFFKQKYPPIVKVYTVGPDDAPFSRELCGGPHVTNTGTIGHFKITKEESISAGTRRIRATVD